MKDPYRVLGVSKGDDEDTIKKAYKKLVRKYHPDVSKDPNADARFKEVNAAWDVLQDPQKRKMYDQFGHVPGSGGGPPPGAGGFGGDPYPGGGGFRADFGGGAVNMEDILSQMFGAGAAGGGYARQRPGRDVHTSMSLEPMLAFTGGETSIVLQRPGGQPETLRVRIPAGVEDGKTLRLRGRGQPPPGGGPAGDLHIKLSIAEHPVLRRRGSDLEMDVPITIGEAVRGATIRVPTPTGDIEVKVPPGAKSGQRMRLRKRGVQVKSGPGNLYLVLRPHLPDCSTPEFLEAVDVIEEAYDADVRADLKL